MARNSILIVDDNTSTRELIARHLNRLGYRIFTALDGKEAQDMIVANGVASIDLLLTDLNLPRLRGDELAEWFVRNNAQAKVIVMSDGPGEDNLCRGADYIQKPFYPEMLGLMIGKLFSPTRPSAATMRRTIQRKGPYDHKTKSVSIPPICTNQ